MCGIEHEVPDHICKFRGVQVFLNSQSHVFPRDALLWIRCTTQLVITQDEIKNIVGLKWMSESKKSMWVRPIGGTGRSSSFELV